MCRYLENEKELKPERTFCFSLMVSSCWWQEADKEVEWHLKKHIIIHSIHLCLNKLSQTYADE